MREELKYEVLVSASSPQEALEIASEGLSPSMSVVRSEVRDVSAEEGKDSYRVTLWFTGGRRGGDGSFD